MKNILLLATLCLITTLTSPAQTAPAHPPATNNKNKILNGMRFVSIDRLPDKKLYLYLAKNHYQELTIRSGTPGEQYPYPEGGKLILLRNIPQGNQKPDIVLQTHLPASPPAKMIIVLGHTGNSYYNIPVDETILKPGTTLFKNITTKTYLIEIPDAPAGEPKQHLLAAGQDYLFGRTTMTPAEDGKTYKTTWKHEKTLKNGQKQWFIERQSMTMRYMRRAIITLLRPDNGGQTVIAHEIITFLPAAPNQPAVGSTNNIER